jgi:hypothetical protein
MDVKLDNVLEVPSVLRVTQFDIHTSELHPMLEITQSIFLHLDLSKSTLGAESTLTRIFFKKCIKKKR